MIRNILIYGLLVGSATLLLNVMQYKLLVLEHSTELYVAMIGVCFLILGLWMGRKLFHQEVKDMPQVHTATNTPDQVAVTTTPVANTPHFGLSRRELEILALVVAGHSNQEIADMAYVSLSTVKTHVSNIYLKLDVERRAQAINKAKELNLLA